VGKGWSILFGVVMAACGLLFVVAYFAGWWLPKNVSSYGHKVDNLFYLILAITGFFFILTEAILVYNVYKFSDRPPETKAQYVHGNHQLEMFWTAIPAVILLLIAFLQIGTWEEIKYRGQMPVPSKDRPGSKENFQFFEVSARQFEWRVRYPTSEALMQINSEWADKGERVARDWAEYPHQDDIHVVNELHTWKNAEVRFYLTTRDVLHSFYLPNLRLKQDAVPGKIIPVWFKPTESNIDYDEATKSWKQQDGNVWDLACAELCGWGHYKMLGRLYVHKDKADYERWLKETQDAQGQTKP
jgi:cytochrome c oxidase subunit 2